MDMYVALVIGTVIGALIGAKSGKKRWIELTLRNLLIQGYIKIRLDENGQETMVKFPDTDS